MEIVIMGNYGNFYVITVMEIAIMGNSNFLNNFPAQQLGLWCDPI